MMKLSTQNGILSISGEVTVKTVNESLYRQFEQQCRLKDVHTLDFSQVTRADSACISLLLTALRLQNKTMNTQQLPESVRALAELYEINHWIHS